MHVNTKLYPNELSAKDLVKFYRQEVFEGQSSLKIYLFLLSILLLTLDKIGDSVVVPHLIHIKTHVNILHICFLAAAFVAYTVSLKSKSLQRRSGTFNLRLILNSLAACFLTVYIILENIDSVEIAIESGKTHNWSNALEEYASSIPLVILMITLMPTWYLKAMLPCGYCFAMIFSYFRTSHVMKYWILSRLGVSCLIIIALIMGQSRFRWQQFKKNLETDGWNQVYQDVLSRIPSALGVVNLDGEIIYSNLELKKLMERKNFKDIVQVKKRYCSIRNLSTRREHSFRRDKSVSTNEFKLNIPQDDLFSPTHHNNNEESYLTKFGHKTQENFFEDRLRHLTSDYNARTFFEQACEFENLGEVLNAFKGSMQASEEPIGEKHLVYDGKLFPNNNNLNIENRPQVPASYEIRLCPLYEYQKVIVILNNTTERDLVASAEENSHYKDRLLASISHNLRTPLNGSLTFLQGAINDNKIDNTVKDKLIAPAIRSGTLLLNLINDILDYSLLESHEFSLCLEFKSLQNTLKNAFTLLKDAIIAKNLTCHIEIDDQIPSKFNTDHHRVTQIVLNLLGNAIKFTYKGSITLKVRYIDPTKVEIAIQDTGIGMRRFELETLKNELINPSFSSGKSGKSKGIGLGLKISNDLAKKLNLDNEEEQGITIESTRNQGSTFSFIVANYKLSEDQLGATGGFSSPFALESHFDKAAKSGSGNLVFSKINLSQISEIDTLNEVDKKYNRFTEAYGAFNPALKSPHHSNSNRLKQLTPRGFGSSKLKLDSPRLLARIPREILVVDDDPMNILGVELLLNKLNISIVKAYNGQQAIERIQERAHEVAEGNAVNFKAILMDCQMPVMDGYKASKILKEMMENGETAMTPIIGCTAFTARNKLEECLACGMDAVITKPVSFKRLCEMFDN